MARGIGNPREIVRKPYIAGIFSTDSAPGYLVHDVLINRPAHRTQFARAFTRPSAPGPARRHDRRRRDRGGGLFAVADLGSGWIERTGAAAGQYRRHPRQRAA